MRNEFVGRRYGKTFWVECTCPKALRQEWRDWSSVVESREQGDKWHKMRPGHRQGQITAIGQHLVKSLDFTHWEAAILEVVAIPWSKYALRNKIQLTEMAPNVLHHLAPAQVPCPISWHILKTLPQHTLYTSNPVYLPVGNSFGHWVQYCCLQKLLLLPAAGGSGWHREVKGPAAAGHTFLSVLPLP